VRVGGAIFFGLNVWLAGWPVGQLVGSLSFTAVNSLKLSKTVKRATKYFE
jgi:hypothetical protein